MVTSSRRESVGFVHSEPDTVTVLSSHCSEEGETGSGKGRKGETKKGECDPQIAESMLDADNFKLLVTSESQI